MKNQTRSFMLGLCSTLLLFIPTLGSSAQLNISNAPLFNSTAVEPNVFFVVDDSLNMEMDQMNADLRAQGQYVIANQSYRFLIPMNGSYHYGDATILPSQDAVAAHNLAVGTVSGTEILHDDANGVWRARNHNFNRLYYNPAVTYKPWQGVNNANAAYASISNPQAVPWDPYDSASAVIDLTADASWSSNVTTVSGGVNTVAVTGYHIPRYYEWTDTNANGVVDANDAHTLHEIRLVGCSLGAVCSSSYTRPATRTDCATPGTCSALEELRNFANWWAYHRTRDKVVKAALSEVVNGSQDIRMGLSTTHNNLTRYEIASMNAASKTGLMSQLFQYHGRSAGSPLKAALERAGNYYACGGSATSNSNHFTYYPASAADSSISLSGNLFGNSNCPIDSNSDIGRCQQNFTVLISDGFDSPHGELLSWNGQPGAPIDPQWHSITAGDPDNVRLYNDPFGASAVNSDGDSNSPFSGAPYADSYSDTLADVAMHFYKTDLSTFVDDVPTQAGVDENPAQHMVTFGVSLGLPGTLTDADNPTNPGFAWPNPANGIAEKIDDLRHAAYNGRGKFFNAANPEQLSSALNSSVKSVSERIGSAAAVAFNTTTLSTDTSIYLALFNSSRWSGDLVSYRLDPNTGVIGIHPLWRAADMLDSMGWATRRLYTSNGSAGIDMSVFANLTLDQQADLNMGPSGVADGLGVARLNYLRGDRSDETGGNNFRVRSSLLGDIVHSGPVYVGQPNLNWPDVAPFPTGIDDYTHFRNAQALRQGMVYVGANDGSLHAFSATNGEEKFAYVPNALFSSSVNQGMHYLTDPSYIHKYSVDQTVTVSDVFSGGSWKSLLIGSLGAGGRGVYILDVTDPNNFDQTKVLGELSSAVDANLGFTFSRPVVALTNALDASSNPRFAAIFGNGYNNGGSYRPALFIVFLDADLSNGWQMGLTATDDYYRIDVPTDVAYGDSTTPNGLSSPALIDSNSDGMVDRAYAGDLQGNLWGFDLAATWAVAHDHAGTKVPLFSGSQAITVRPAVGLHTDGVTPVVLFGTGSYMTASDPGDIQAGEFYGVYDEASFTNTYTDASLQVQSLVATTGTDYRVVQNNAIPNNKHGWKIPLVAGERVVTNPLVRGDIVYFNTTIPSSVPCDTGGTGWLMSVDFTSGGEPVAPIFDYNNDGVVNLADKVENGTHAAAGKYFNKGLPASSTVLGNRRYTVGSETGGGGDVVSDEVENLGGPSTGRLSWEQLKRGL